MENNLKRCYIACSDEKIKQGLCSCHLEIINSEFYGALDELFITDSEFDISEKEIIKAADEWVFNINGTKWSNNDNTAGDNFGSFIAGAKFILDKLNNHKS